MSSRFLRASKLFFTLLVLTIFIHSCQKKTGIIQVNPAFSPYVAAFTSGIISKSSQVKIIFKQPVHNLADNNLSGLLKFSPSIKGKLDWEDARTLVFTPDTYLPSGTRFTVKLALGSIVKELPRELETMTFQFQVMAQHYESHIESFQPYDLSNLEFYYLRGVVKTADVATREEILGLLEVKQDKSLKVSWDHEADGRVHYFRVDSLRRHEQASMVSLQWDGKSLGTRYKSEESFNIPALGDFSVVSHRVIQNPEQCIILIFSDPINESQDLTGLIRLLSDAASTTLKHTINGNEIRVYPSRRLFATATLLVEPGLCNIMGYGMQDPYEAEIVFEEIRPSVRFIGQGVILPSSGQMSMPFEAVNLRAVDVKVIRIFENNITQFFQTNLLDGESQLRRVGRLVYASRVDLYADVDVNLKNWNTFSLDLSNLIRTEPGAIYRVTLSYIKKYSLYRCSGASEDEQPGPLPAFTALEKDDWQDESGYYYYDDYGYDAYYDDEYDWRQRENPCHSTYYRYKSISRNLLASDIGLLAKMGDDRKLMVVATDIRTAEPLVGIEIEAIDYQNQVIGRGRTDGKGFASLSPQRKPFLLIARNKMQRGYLRLDDGNALSMSMFDVGGEVVQRGLKGFLYGERGVWRPGDTLFLTFILEDMQNRLPARHPVTFELYNPHGQLVQKETQNGGLDGFYHFQPSTRADAPTGSWSARVKVGGASFNRSIRVETIKPNRLKIDLSLGKTADAVLSGPMEGKLSARWLHGAKARNLKARVAVTLRPGRTSFKGFEKYSFDDPVLSLEPEEVLLYDGALDADGQAILKADMPEQSKAPGMLTAHFSCRVFEEGGDFSTDVFSRLYAPFPTFVGVKLPEGERHRDMLFTGESHQLEIVSLSAEGKAKRSIPVEVEVYKLEWRWWWDASRENLANWTGKIHGQLVKNERLITNEQGKAGFKLEVGEHDWGRYLIRVHDEEGGHYAGRVVYIDWSGWESRGRRGIPGGATMLSFSTDKSSYKTGEVVKLNFPSSTGGRALVSIENGTQVLDAHWVVTQDKETQFHFKVREEMAPNAYIHITLIQKHDQALNDAPIRLYGVVPLLVENPETKLSPRIDIPNVLAPEEKVRIHVSEAGGKAMTYTIAMVDEGLLDLTRFATPDPWNVFYAREALGVKTWDLFDMIMGARGGKIERLMAIGGDEGLQPGGARKAERFKPMVKYLGPFHLKAGASQSHEIHMPAYIGSVRTMVVAGFNGAYGSASKTTPVRKPLMVLSTLPRVLGPGETVRLPVTVFAMEAGIKTVDVEIQTNALLGIKEGKSKTVHFPEPGEQVVEFELIAADREGIGEVKVEVRSGKEKASTRTELDVRVANPELVTTYDGMIEKGKSWNLSFEPAGLPGTNHAILEVSTTPPINLEKRLHFLISYPHGCLEQITSAVFPQLFLADFLELSREHQERSVENIKAAIQKMSTYLLPSGGFSYWPGTAEYNDWGSTYAGHFLLEAEAKGYVLPAGLKNSWLRYQRQAANQWTANTDPRRHYMGSDLAQAYRLYTLALAGSPEMGAMNRLRASLNLSPQAIWRLAAAYALAGQKDIARKMVEQTTTQVPAYTEMSGTFGSGSRDLAMILETMVLIGEGSKALPTARELASHLSSDQWMSTQATAYGLIAMAKFTGGQIKASGLNYAASLNSKAMEEVKTQKPIHTTVVPVKGMGSYQLTVSNRGAETIYTRLMVRGKPKAGEEKAAQRNIRLDVTYLSMDGKPLNISLLEQGTDFMAQFTLYNPGTLGRLSELALEFIVASGWEIRNIRMDPGLAVHMIDMPKYQDVRDDRVYSYLDLDANQKQVIRVMLSAAYAGRYYLPAVRCAAMYNDQVSSVVTGRWVEVLKAAN